MDAGAASKLDAMFAACVAPGADAEDGGERAPVDAAAQANPQFAAPLMGSGWPAPLEEPS